MIALTVTDVAFTDSSPFACMCDENNRCQRHQSRLAGADSGCSSNRKARTTISPAAVACACCSLPTLPAVCCVLCAVCCVCCVLCAVCCVLCPVCCVLCAVYCVLCPMCCVPCPVNCASYRQSVTSRIVLLAGLSHTVTVTAKFTSPP